MSRNGKEWKEGPGSRARRLGRAATAAGLLLAASVSASAGAFEGTAGARDAQPGEAAPSFAPAPRDPGWRLAYSIPEGWISDAAMASRMEVTALLVPEGETLPTPSAMITIEFQPKNFRLPVPKTLEEFFKSQMRPFLMLFPDLQSERWRPDSLERTPIPYASLEVFGAEEGKPRPHRVIMIDAGDGFYSIDIAVMRREDLDREDLRLFYESLILLPR